MSVYKFPLTLTNEQKQSLTKTNKKEQSPTLTNEQAVNDLD